MPLQTAVPPKRSWKRHVQELPAEQRTEADGDYCQRRGHRCRAKTTILSCKGTFECITFEPTQSCLSHHLFSTSSDKWRNDDIAIGGLPRERRIARPIPRARYALRTEGISSPVLGRSVMRCDEKLHHSLKSPACSCVSSTLPASS
jgi:hypothetical protein